ncbi:MAG: hypothetical protein IH881_03140 [Myxococcales bacterium]|nr:hypothetical protein [Myxococcales bacterium]
MFHNPIHLLGLLVLAAGLSGIGFCSLGCASLDAKDSSPLPATMTGLRAEIDEQRALLMNLVSETHLDTEHRDDNADRMVAIAKRLTQLTTALVKLEPNSTLNNTHNNTPNTSP